MVEERKKRNHEMCKQWSEREKRQDGIDKVSVNNVNNAAWKWKVGGEILNDVGFTSPET